MNVTEMPAITIPLGAAGALFLYALVAGWYFRSLQAWVDGTSNIRLQESHDEDRRIAAAMWPVFLPFTLLYRIVRLAFRAGRWRPEKKTDGLPEARVVRGGGL